MCTRAKSTPRGLTLRPERQHRAIAPSRHRAIAAARERQTDPSFRAAYAARAGIEGTLSQGVRAFELRQARYRGLAKTHLQHVATATAINFAPLFSWFQEVPRAPTRQSRFAALALAA